MVSKKITALKYVFDTPDMTVQPNSQPNTDQHYIDSYFFPASQKRVSRTKLGCAGFRVTPPQKGRKEG